MANRGLQHRFVLTVDARGERICAPAQSAGEDLRPEVVVLGDSFGFGWGVNDDQAMVWIAQTQLPEVHLRNWSVPGYNNVHALRQIGQLASSPHKPRAAIVLYRDDFLERNVGTAKWLAILSQGTVNASSTTPPSYLRVQWRAGQWTQELVPLTPAGIAAAGQQHDSRQDQVLAAIALFAAMRDQASAAGIELLVGLQQHDSHDPVVAALKGAGYTLLNLIPPPEAWKTLHPIDFHPGPVTQAYYGTALAKQLRPHLPRLTGQP
jgi:hypothetical protein